MSGEKSAPAFHRVCCSTNSITLKKVRQSFQNVKLVASAQEDQITPEALGVGGKMNALNLFAFNIKAESYKTEYRETLDAAGLKCFIWDLQTEEALREFLPFKPHAIYSDFPDLAVKIRDEFYPD